MSAYDPYGTVADPHNEPSLRYARWSLGSYTWLVMTSRPDSYGWIPWLTGQSGKLRPPRLKYNWPEETYEDRCDYDGKHLKAAWRRVRVVGPGDIRVDLIRVGSHAWLASDVWVSEGREPPVPLFRRFTQIGFSGLQHRAGPVGPKSLEFHFFQGNGTNCDDNRFLGRIIITTLEPDSKPLHVSVRITRSGALVVSAAAQYSVKRAPEDHRDPEKCVASANEVASTVTEILFFVLLPFLASVAIAASALYFWSDWVSGPIVIRETSPPDLTPTVAYGIIMLFDGALKAIPLLAVVPLYWALYNAYTFYALATLKRRGILANDIEFVDIVRIDERVSIHQIHRQLRRT